MKNLLFYLTILLSSQTYCQKKSFNNIFKINGQIIGKDTGNVIFWYSNKENIFQRDTIRLKNGRFKLKGTVNGICEGILWTDDKNIFYDDKSVIRFLLEPTEYFIYYSDKESSSVKIKGGKSQLEKETWEYENKELVISKINLNKRIDSLLKLAKKDSNLNINSMLEKEGIIKDSILQKFRSNDVNYIRKHNQSLFSAYLLNKHNRKLSINSVQELYQKFSTKIKKSSIGKELLEYIYPLTDDLIFKAQNPLIDKEFNKKLVDIKSIYDFTLKDSSGKNIYFDMFKGKYIYIDFWASWCKPCISNMPALKNLINEYKLDTIEFISISLDTEIEKWKISVKKQNLDGVQLCEPMGFKGLIAIYCKTLWVGHYVIVDKLGKIINFDAPSPSDPELKKILNTFLNKRPITGE